MSREPHRRVLESFGGDGDPTQMSGGQGTSWRAGDVVLKPAEQDSASSLVWLDQVARPLLCDCGLRIALPVAGAGGELLKDGWTATRLLRGTPLVGAWDKKADVARRLARSFSRLNPHELPPRNDPWGVADRAVWDTPAVTGLRDHPLVEGLRPVDAPLAVVHGDIAGNVLFDPHMPPAVIDLSLYARPVEWSVALLAIDAVCFEGAPLSLLGHISPDPDFPQYLARALLFRMNADVLLGGGPGRAYDQAVRYTLDTVRVL